MIRRPRAFNALQPHGGFTSDVDGIGGQVHKRMLIFRGKDRATVCLDSCCGGRDVLGLGKIRKAPR